MRKNHVGSSLIFRMRAVSRSLFVLVVVIAAASAATAYTVVFRDGHKVEVPPVFTLTANTITYEAAPGINRTMQLVLIDIPATERVNGEVPGSFVKHAEQKQPALSPGSPRHAQHTLTNLDLEASRQRRLDSQQSYEKRRIELGLPSIEETRRRQAQDEEATLDLARRRAADAANGEAYWRGRARSLRSEIVSVDGEINYWRGRVNPNVPFVTQGFITGSGAFGSFAGRRNLIQPGAGRMGTQGGSPALSNLGAVPLRPQRPSRVAAAPFGYPFVPYLYRDDYYNGSDVGIRLKDLLARRAGLDAQWRQLEQEARLARVPQIWLAP
ncbi:MAG: hypothetical protein QOK48_3576 [Blastocatellia bacterium]|jgi:hypothetical protein|nr:hypothetical protein [Blastocatellia bacterium]